MPPPTFTWNMSPKYPIAGSSIAAWLDGIYDAATADPRLRVITDRRLAESVLEIAFAVGSDRENDRVVFTALPVENDSSNNVAGSPITSGLAMSYGLDVGTSYVADSRKSANLWGSNLACRFSKASLTATPDNVRVWVVDDVLFMTLENDAGDREFCLLGAWLESETTGLATVATATYQSQASNLWASFVTSSFFGWGNSPTGATLLPATQGNDTFLYRMHGENTSVGNLENDDYTLAVPIPFGIGNGKFIGYWARQIGMTVRVTNLESMPSAVGGYIVGGDLLTETDGLALMDTRFEDIPDAFTAPPLLTWDFVNMDRDYTTVGSAEALLQNIKAIILESGHYVATVDNVATEGFVEFAPVAAGINTDRLLLFVIGVGGGLAVDSSNTVTNASLGPNYIYATYSVGTGGTMTKARIEAPNMYADGAEVQRINSGFSNVLKMAYGFSAEGFYLTGYFSGSSQAVGIIAGRLFVDPAGAADKGIFIGAGQFSAAFWIGLTGRDFPTGNYTGSAAQDAYASFRLSDGATSTNVFMSNSFPSDDFYLETVATEGLGASIRVIDTTTDQWVGYMRQIKAAPRLSNGPTPILNDIDSSIVGYGFPADFDTEADALMISVGH